MICIGVDGNLWKGDDGPDSETTAEATMGEDGEIVIEALRVRVLPTTGFRVGA